ncbi:TPA: hypothetical protein SMT61_003561 [Proteus mirabilis]|uniref:hypothetical protein n=1 Tax=Proteus mirabilis TaxID=584 RepID=UPI000D8C78DB|nr:hypothetical protein [Proteus mirabilis]EMA4642809.1 hypothetical protein [Proteus mirabilis]MBG5961712.1 hypothetical protein [Proteus mirabilis]MBL1397046.1 hypothetical protein [Proteus mirabilis]MBQ0656116.1 hypothetical protein [Proteus mirabilis]MDL2104963.1 hypothetical protein [Proteus mirabilis]
MTTRNQEIATTILSQMGGNRFIVMTGAKYFVAIENGLQFKLPARFAINGINCVQVILDPSDTYTMRFLKIHGVNSKEIEKVEGLFFDQLQIIFTEKTGLYTHL